MNVFQQEMEEEGGAAESSKFLLSHDDPERAVDPEMQARLETLLEVAGEFLFFFFNYSLYILRKSYKIIYYIPLGISKYS